eukprot:COSAG02_NODE_12519_length_1533_cov_3.272664_2_plen_63_part_00
MVALEARRNEGETDLDPQVLIQVASAEPSAGVRVGQVAVAVSSRPVPLARFSEKATARHRQP